MTQASIDEANAGAGSPAGDTAAMPGGAGSRPADPPRAGGLLARLEAHHRGKLLLCEALEAIADSLPDRVDAEACRLAANCARADLAAAHRFEELRLWPALRRRHAGHARLEASLERLRYEHWEDESYGEEVAAHLSDWAEGKGGRNAEATGYMLRGFFEGLRRHIAFERELIAPLLSERGRERE